MEEQFEQIFKAMAGNKDLEPSALLKLTFILNDIERIIDHLKRLLLANPNITADLKYSYLLDNIKSILANYDK